jgi:hypothetical protein
MKIAWAPVPRQFPHNSLLTQVHWFGMSPPDKAGFRLSFLLMPGNSHKNTEAGEAAKWKWNAGFDTKMILSHP